MYTLPSLYPNNTVAEAWPRLRRNWLEEIERVMLGTAPKDSSIIMADIQNSEEIYSGEGVRETVRIVYGTAGREASLIAEVTRPNQEGRFPVITWNQFADDSVCPAEREALGRGYVIAAFKRDLLYEDKAGGKTPALHTFGGKYTWRAIRAWAFGHSMLLDYLETCAYADPGGFIATGHSRGGKAALAAGAYDERFSVVAPNNSGCGGAGCFRVLAGRDGKREQNAMRVETLGRIAAAYPYWFADDFARYGGKAPYFEIGSENGLSFDLHTLKAMVAPRFLLTLEGLDDTWSNPYGTYVTWRAAQPIFDLLSAGDRNAIYYREGKHAFGEADWLALLDFCDQALRGKPSATRFNNAPFTV